MIFEKYFKYSVLWAIIFLQGKIPLRHADFAKVI